MGPSHPQRLASHAPAPNLKGLDREAAAQAQFAWLGDLASPEFLARLKVLGRDARLEMLALVIREGFLRGQPDLGLPASNLLIGTARGDKLQNGRLEGYIYSRAKKLGFADDPERLEEFRSEFYARIVRALRKGFYEAESDDGPDANESKKPAFICKNFLRVMKLVTLDVTRRILRQERRHGLLEPAPAAPEAVAPKTDIRFLLNRLVIQQAVQQLRPKQRQAIELHYLQDLKIESIKPEEKTVSTEMGLEPKSVRNHLRAAEAALRAQARLREIWNDDI